MSKRQTQKRNQVQTDKDSLLIKQGDLVSTTLRTEGWKKIIEPLIDKMIADVVGGKNGNVWDPGSFGDKRMGEVKAQNLLWYRRALIDLNNHIYSYIAAAENAKKSLELRNKEKPEKFNPMLDGDYSPIHEVGQDWSSYSADEDGGTNG